MNRRNSTAFLLNAIITILICFFIAPHPTHADVIKEYEMLNSASWDPQNPSTPEHLDITSGSPAPATGFTWRTIITDDSGQTNTELALAPHPTKNPNNAIKINIGNSLNDEVLWSTNYLNNIRLDEIQEISYNSYLADASFDTFTGITMVLYVDLTGDGYNAANDGRIVFQPQNNYHLSENSANTDAAGNINVGEWQQWRAIPGSGIWRDINMNIAPSGVGFTLDELLIIYPDAIIAKEDNYSFEIGTFYSNVNIFLDDITFDLANTSSQEGAVHRFEHSGLGGTAGPIGETYELNICFQDKSNAPLDNWSTHLFSAGNYAYNGVTFDDSSIQSNAGIYVDDIFYGFQDRTYFVEVNGNYNTENTGIGDAQSPFGLAINNRPIDWQPTDGSSAFGADSANNYYTIFEHLKGGPIRFHFEDRIAPTSSQNNLETKVYSTFSSEKVSGDGSSSLPGCAMYEVGFEGPVDLKVFQIQQNGWELVNLTRDDGAILYNGQSFTIDRDMTLTYTNQLISMAPDPSPDPEQIPDPVETGEVEICLLNQANAEAVTDQANLTLGGQTLSTSSTDGCVIFSDIAYGNHILTAITSDNWQQIALETRTPGATGSFQETQSWGITVSNPSTSYALLLQFQQQIVLGDTDLVESGMSTEALWLLLLPFGMIVHWNISVKSIKT